MSNALSHTGIVLLDFDVVGVQNIVLVGAVGEVIDIPVGQEYDYNGSRFRVVSWSLRDDTIPVDRAILLDESVHLYANATQLLTVNFTDGTISTTKVYSAGQSITMDYLTSTFPIPNGYNAVRALINSTPVQLPYSVESNLSITVEYVLMHNYVLKLVFSSTNSSLGLPPLEVPYQLTQSWSVGSGTFLEGEHSLSVSFPNEGSPATPVGRPFSSVVNMASQSVGFMFLVLNVDGVNKRITSMSGDNSLNYKIWFTNSEVINQSTVFANLSSSVGTDHALIEGCIRLNSTNFNALRAAGTVFMSSAGTLTINW